MKFPNITITDNAGHDYNPVLSMGSNNKPSISFVTEGGCSTPKWGMDLLRFKGDKLYIDMGQGWAFNDVQPMLVKLRKAMHY